MVRVRERRAVEVEAQSVFRTVLRSVEPQKARVGIDEAPDQPRTGDTIDPYPVPGSPPLAAIRRPFQVPNARVQRQWLIRRKVPRDGGLGFSEGLGSLDLGRAGEVVDAHHGL